MKIDPAVLEAIKNMDLPSLIRSYGIELKSVGKNAYHIRCPFHEDKTPSVSVGYRNNKWLWNCFGCRAHGNSLDFRIAYEKITFIEAYQKGAEELHLVSMGTNRDGAAVRPLTSTATVGAKTPFGAKAPSVDVPPLPRPTTINRSELLTRTVQIYHEALLEDRGGMEYLRLRGIKDGDFLKRFKVGHVNGRLRRMLPEDPDHEFVRGLKEVGILNEKGREHFHGCVVFPIFDDNGAVVGMYGRRVATLAWGPEHLYLPGPRQGVWNGGAVKAYKEVILAESIIDAASFHALGCPNAVALYGVNGLTETHLALFREHRTQRVVLCLDNDKAGEEARARVKEKITPLGVEVVDLVLPRHYKDANVALKQGMTAGEFSALWTGLFPAGHSHVAFPASAVTLPSSAVASSIQISAKDEEDPRRNLPSDKKDDGPVPVSAGQAPGPQPASRTRTAPEAPPASVPPVDIKEGPLVPKNPEGEKEHHPLSFVENPKHPTPIPLEIVPPVTEQPRGVEKGAEGPFPVVTETDGGVQVVFARRSYRVRGLTVKELGSLRVNVKVTGSDGHHVDTLDLYSSKARDAFASCCRKIFTVNAGELERELNQLIDVLEGIQGTALGAGDKSDACRLTTEEEAEALKSLRAQNLLERILADMAALGYVGEEANKLVGYLVGISRKLEDPLSCVLMSQSSAGKSVLAETVEKLTPPEDVLLLSRLTTNGLFYMKRNALKHKLLILEERVGAEAADYSIRTLQSKKKLVQAVPVKDEKTGKIETQTFEVEGPIAYIETTSRPRVADDNATRCFELSLDESREQTRRVHEAQRRGKTLSGLKGKEAVERICQRHWNMQRMLREVRVVIPYADRLEFPTTWLRTRRDHMRFLNLIEVICFLHQHQRPVEKTPEGSEYIAATLDDYQGAFDLAGQVMGESLTELKKPQRELLKMIREMNVGGEGLTRREIRERVGLSDTRLRELLGELVSLEYMRQTEGGGRGVMCRYHLADPREGDDRRLMGLTRPEELRKKLGGGVSPEDENAGSR